MLRFCFFPHDSSFCNSSSLSAKPFMSLVELKSYFNISALYCGLGLLPSFFYIYSLKSTLNDRFLKSFSFWKFLLLSEFLPEICWEEGENTNIKKWGACVYHLLRGIARSLLFRLHISNDCFYNQKKKKNNYFITVLTLNAKLTM